MKKILSLILALSLIISVAPMSFAVEEEWSAETPGMYFNFGAAGYGSETDIGYDTINSYDDCYKSGTSQKYKTPTYATTGTDPWYIDGESYTYDADEFFLTDADGLKKDTNEDAVVDDVYQPNALSFKASGNNAVHPTSGTNKEYNRTNVVISLDVKEKGVFIPSLTYRVGPTSPKYYVYLVPKTWSQYTGYSLRKFIGFTGGCINKQNLPQNLVTNSNRLKYTTGYLLGTIDMYNEEEKTVTTYFPAYEIANDNTDYMLFFSVSNVNTTLYNKYGRGKLPDYIASIYSFNLTPVPAKDLADAAFTATQDPDYNSETAPAPTSATVKTLALYGETSANIDTETVTYGSTATINTVPATVTRDDGTYNFLYWAKGLDNGVGNKHIISTSNAKFTYKPHEGNNFLIAVYEKEGAEKEAAFYDRNGQLLNPVITDNKLPALPAMAGLGDAIGWEQLGTGEVFPAEYDFSTLEGDKVFMAKYNELSENITISINGVSDTYAYGDTVTCESDDANFSYWEKTINGKKQIVSIDKTYTFKAWESCTITAVCNGTVTEADLSRGARKILLSTFSVGKNLTAVMAEFIGFDGAKEKGIMFGEKKIAMTTDYAQFTVTNDTNAAVTVTGYAIVDEAGETVKYTDGSITVAGVTAAE